MSDASNTAIFAAESLPRERLREVGGVKHVRKLLVKARLDELQGVLGSSQVSLTDPGVELSDAVVGGVNQVMFGESNNDARPGPVLTRPMLEGKKAHCSTDESLPALGVC